ncbi:MAG: hypothetical protein H7Y08_12575, partial [Rhizobiaceae bacterium]|nr:hypothetical protein [Rhizobiaceae bacterium]
MAPASDTPLEAESAAGSPLLPVTEDGRQTKRTRAAHLDRIEPLATLPVFFDLAGRRVAMAGGGAGAAWKAEL